MKSRIHISSILIFGALSTLLIMAILLGAKQIEGSPKTGNGLGAYPAPVTQAPTSVKPTGTPKGSEPTKSVITTKAPSLTEPTVVNRDGSSVTPSPTPVILENGWYLYTDPKAGYSISYPPNTVLTTNEYIGNQYTHIGLQFSIADTGGYQGMFIYIIDNPDGRPIENIIAESYNSALPDLSANTVKQSWTSLKVGNLEGFKTTFRPSFYELSVFVPLKNKVVVMSPAHDMANTAVDPKTLELFYQIVATFSVVN